MENLQASADLTFLALAGWREASDQSPLVILAVDFSILDRVHRPCWWGHDLMSVVFKKWQYSSLTAPGDPNLTRWPAADDPSWQRSMCAASEALAGSVPNPVPNADSYYDVSIPPPPWAKPENFVAALGRLRFHNVGFDHEAPALRV